MFHGTLQPLAGAARTLSQLAEDGLLPGSSAPRRHRRARGSRRRDRRLAIVFLLIGDPVWLVAAANFTYLIGIACRASPSGCCAATSPPASVRTAPRAGRSSRMVAAGIWGSSTILGFQQFGLPTVIAGLGLA